MEEDYVMIPGTGTKKIIRDVKKEIETAFLDYSMSVIVSRALPDVRDGLKPVHRRILFTMHERGNDPAHPYRKSADTVGAVLGSYHPHGDASVYDAMVRLAQDFSMRYPLVDGQGNFGSVDGDPPAAYRYTEARMSRMAVEMLTDIDKDTVDWDPNYDDTKKEPQVLPCRFPNLLVNGSQGIAVGMATNIPPHNLGEVIDGCIAYIDNPDIDLAGLMEYIKGPDFPTAGIIMGRSGIRAAYATGRGKITLRGRAVIEEKKNGRFQIVVTEIPYMVNKARLIENIAELVKDKRVDGISDLNDETNRKGMRIVIGLRRDAGPAKPYLIFALTDETYSLVCSGDVPAGVDRRRYWLLVSLFDQLYWVAGSLAGALVGGLLPFDTTGIDFSMTALFLVVMTEQWRAARDHTAALVGLGVSLACLAVFGADNFLIPAMVGITLALTLLRRRPGAPEQEGAHASH